jgi:hypothetical protein
MRRPQPGQRPIQFLLLDYFAIAPDNPELSVARWLALEDRKLRGGIDIIDAAVTPDVIDNFRRESRIIE